MENKSLAIIGAAIGWGAKLPETEFGPQVVFDSGLLEKLIQAGLHCNWHKIIHPAISLKDKTLKTYEEKLEALIPYNQVLAHLAAEAIAKKQMLLTIGGDHTCAIGNWSGVISELKAQKEFGLMWIDAHMDAHTPHTTPSFAIHGMPLAALLGHGEKELIDCHAKGAKLNPKHVVLIGVRSFEQGEAEFLASLNVRIYKMEEIKDRGLSTVMEEALKIVLGAKHGFGVSLDLDAFDPAVVPGVGTPAPGGLFPDGFLPELKHVLRHPQLKAFEIAEFNPKLDKNNLTLNLIHKLACLL